MEVEGKRPQTFIKWVLALLDERFPWLGSGQDERAARADAVRGLSDLHKSLIQ